MADLSHCRLCGGVVRVALLPGWGNEPVGHQCPPVDHPCHQCESAGECQARTPCQRGDLAAPTDTTKENQ